MTVEEYLEEPLKLDKEILGYQAMLQYYQELGQRTSQVLCEFSGSGNRNIHRLEDTVIKITEYKNKIAEGIDQVVSLKSRSYDIIHQLENVDYRNVFEMLYVCGMHMNEVATRVGYSTRQIYRIKRDGLRLLEENEVVKRIMLENADYLLD